MMIVRGKDGAFSASQQGAMGRWVACSDPDYHKALAGCYTLLEEQQSEAYHHQASMEHLAEASLPDYTPTSGFEYEI